MLALFAFRRLFAALSMLLAFAPAAAFADGKVFARLDQLVTIPDQEAMIVFDPARGEQTLVIETRFIGRGTDFAWVVPLPDGLGSGPPDIFPTTKGTFPTLRSVFAARIELFSSHGAWMLVYLAVMFMLAIVIPRRAPLWQVAIYILCMAFLGALLLLPSLGKARASAKGLGETPVEVLNRQVVGSFETATIRSSDAEALSAWLAANGYAPGAEVQPVIADYVRRGWLFVASRIRRDADAVGTLTPHPIGFRFTTPSAVYPLALTGVNNTNLTVDLYVFGPGTAAAKHFEVIRTQPVSWEPAGVAPSGPADSLVIGHPRIVELAGQSAHATKLHAELSPAQMRQDAQISFSSPSTRGDWSYSLPAAVNFAGTIAAGVLALATFAILLQRAGRVLSRSRAVRQIVWSVPCCLAAGGISFVLVPKTADYTARTYRSMRSGYDLREVRTLLDPQTELKLRQASAAATGPSSPEAILSALVAADLREWGYADSVSLIGDVDAPGLAVIRRVPGAVEYAHYDQVGRETTYRFPIGQ